MEGDPDSHTDIEPARDLGLDPAEYSTAYTSAEVPAHDGDPASSGKGGCFETGGIDPLSVSKSMVECWCTDDCCTR